MSTHDEVMAAITANDPPIQPGQIWVARVGEQISRAVRIYALWPDPIRSGTGMGNGWIFSDDTNIFTRHRRLDDYTNHLGIVPEYNLRMIFELARSSLPPASELLIKLDLPHQTLIEVEPGGSASVHLIKTVADVDRLARDLHACISTLEGIAHFNSGSAGDEAMKQLQRMGVWSERVQKIEG